MRIPLFVVVSTRDCSYTVQIDLKKLLLFKLVSVIGIGGHNAKYRQTECQLGLLFGEDLVVKVISEANEVGSIL